MFSTAEFGERAADFDWSPDGSEMMGLVITSRPDTRKRVSGIIVLIDAVY